MISLKNIAQRAGISTMAVSKALRDAPDISAATKSRVQKLAVEMGYVRNRSAQGLRNQPTHTLGVLLPRLDLNFFAAILAGIARDARAAGYQILAAQSEDNPAFEAEQLLGMLERRVDGIILAPAPRMEKRLDFLRQAESHRLPVVFVDRFPAGADAFPRTGFVMAQDRQGAELATQRLLELGHKRIVHLAGPMGSSTTEERLAGYRKALQEKGMLNGDELVFRAGFDIDGGRSAMAQAVSESSDFSAVFAVTDDVAVGACDFLLSQGLRIPGDVSVIGFGDTRLARYHRVPLTTVRATGEEMGAAAFATLRNLILGSPEERRHLPIQLVERESTAAR